MYNWVQGLADLVHDNLPSLSLVSNGAQCILIHKRLYLDHVPLTLLSTLATQVRPRHTVHFIHSFIHSFIRIRPHV